MATVDELMRFADWVQDNILEDMQLKAPADAQQPEAGTYCYSMVKPRAIPVYMPSRSQEEAAAAVPCALVSMLSGQDLPQQHVTTYEITIQFIIFNPGTTSADILQPVPGQGGSFTRGTNTKDLQPNKEAGWQDVFNCLDIARRVIIEKEFIGRWRVLTEKGINFGLNKAEDATAPEYPFFSGYINFTVAGSLLLAASYKDLL